MTVVVNQTPRQRYLDALRAYAENPCYETAIALRTVDADLTPEQRTAVEALTFAHMHGK